MIVATAFGADPLRAIPLTTDDIDDLFALLDDRGLHRFTGGQPDTIVELRSRLDRWAAGRFPDGSQAWLNWILRDRSGTAVGTLQATVVDDRADVAWVIGTAHQGKGYATAGAQAMVTWLEDHGIREIGASIHPRTPGIDGGCAGRGHETNGRGGRRRNRLAPLIDRYRWSARTYGCGRVGRGIIDRRDPGWSNGKTRAFGA